MKLPSVINYKCKKKVGKLVTTLFLTRVKTPHQKHFTVSEVTADWRELLILKSIMWASIVHASEQLDLADISPLPHHCKREKRPI